jgi:hypothetical protein
MRVNIYAEEITDKIDIIEKTTADGVFTGVRFYLELPVTVPNGHGGHAIYRGPFMHKPGDDDSAAVTFWGKRDLQKVLRLALEKLGQFYGAASPRLEHELIASDLRHLAKQGGTAWSCLESLADRVEKL